MLSFARVGEDESVDLGRGPPLRLHAGPSPDGHHLLFAVDESGTTRITVFDIATVARVGEVTLAPGIRGYALAGTVLVWSSPSHVGAMDVTTGVELWRHALRARIYRPWPAIP